MCRKLILCLYCLCLCIIALAQSPKKLAKAQAKADKYYDEALHLKAAKKTEDACRAMQKAINNDPKSPDGYSQLGQWYFDAHKFAEAAAVFRQASARCADGYRRFARPLAKSCLYAGLPDEALLIMGSYRATAKDSAECNYISRQAAFIRQAMIRQTGLQPVPAGPRVNTADPELFPSMAVDSGTLYFTRRVNNIDEDLYYAKADTCEYWYTAHNMGEPPNSLSQESAQFISADGHYLFFCRCENRSENGYAEGGCDLFMAYRITNDTDWTIAQPFGATINTLSYEGMPSLSPDTRELYYVSDKPGGYGGYDIWISRFEDGLWQRPVNAGPSINTDGNETAPFMSADNKTLFFTSDKWPGMGGKDLFVARKQADGTWTRAENLGYPINTAYDEQSACATTDAGKLYFASDRNGPAGNYDIYATALPAALRPAPVGYLSGYVYDSLSKERLNSAAIYLCDSATGDTLYQLRSNRGDASYMITMPAGRTCIVHTAYMGYTDVSDTIALNGSNGTGHTIANVRMLPSDYNPIKPINDSLIATIHFDVNHTELSDSDKAAINTIIAPWLEEKGIIIYVNAYTDNTGTPMINEGLSYKRAAIVANEIISIGIPETMVQAKGWGEANTIAPNDTEEGQRKNRRVEIKIKR